MKFYKELLLFNLLLNIYCLPEISITKSNSISSLFFSSFLNIKCFLIASLYNIIGAYPNSNTGDIFVIGDSNGNFC